MAILFVTALVMPLRVVLVSRAAFKPLRAPNESALCKACMSWKVNFVGCNCRSSRFALPPNPFIVLQLLSCLAIEMRKKRANEREVVRSSHNFNGTT
jgi:hypothetical protein